MLEKFDAVKTLLKNSVSLPGLICIRKFNPAHGKVLIPTWVVGH